MARSVYRSGQVALVRQGALAATVISVGDIMYMSGSNDDAEPADTKEWDTNLSTTQQALADVFLGISWSASTNTESDDVSVDISAESVYEFDCASATFTLGEIISAAQDGSNNALLADKVVSVSGTAAAAIGMTKKEYTSATTRVLCSFSSAYNPSSSNANASMG